MQYRTNTHNHTHTPLLVNAQNGEDCEKEEDYDTNINPFTDPVKFPD